MDQYGRLWLDAKVKGLPITIELGDKDIAFEIMAATMPGNSFQYHPGRRGLFEAFPDNPDDPAIQGVSTLRTSLERVLAARRPDRLPGLKYDVPRPDGGFEERW